MQSTLTELFIDYIKRYGFEKEIFYIKEDSSYKTVSSGQLVKNIISVIKFFAKHDFRKGDRVAIISESSVDWVITDFACMFGGLVSVPVYTSVSHNQIKYILKDSGVRICFVSNKNLLEKVDSIRNELPELKEVIAFHEIKNAESFENKFTLFSSIKAENINTDEALEFLKNLSGKINEQDLLTIIYTSGTTGIPKGVMLSHKNIYSNIIACKKVLPIDENDTFLSYLPYSHVYERTAGYYLALFCGAKIYYAQSIDTIAQQLTEAKPTIVITVPRLLDKIYGKLLKSRDEMKDGISKKLFVWAIDIALRQETSKSSIKWKLANALVYKKIRARTGGKVRFFVSGGGALNKAMGEFFEMTGITVLEGYGMTETSPVISVNPPGKNKYGTVGIPLHGVNVKLSDENEIIVNGELVMMGYYKSDADTLETIKDEWLYTGDIGEIDDEGYLKITDRKKAMIKTSGGKYVVPAQVEELISRLQFAENVMIIGNGRMYVTCLIVPDKDELISFSKVNGIEFKTYEELLENKSLHKIIQKEIDKLQKELSGYEQVRKFTLLKNPFSIETGELTPTMKVRRKFVEEKYKDEIDKMYL